MWRHAQGMEHHIPGKVCPPRGTRQVRPCQQDWNWCCARSRHLHENSIAGPKVSSAHPHEVRQLKAPGRLPGAALDEASIGLLTFVQTACRHEGSGIDQPGFWGIQAQLKGCFSSLYRVLGLTKVAKGCCEIMPANASVGEPPNGLSINRQGVLPSPQGL